MTHTLHEERIAGYDPSVEVRKGKLRGLCGRIPARWNSPSPRGKRVISVRRFVPLPIGGSEENQIFAEVDSQF